MDGSKQTLVDRRDFLKLSGASLGGLALRSSDHVVAATPSKNDVAVLYDASKCIGCRICERACKEWNNLPAGPVPPSDLSATTWNLIKQRKEVDPADWPFYFQRCMHCTEASCVAVCPTGAAHHEGEIVVIDQNWCIGCGYCVEACPFDVPHLGHGTEKGSARKCWFCFDRVSQGEQPACSEACPTGALQFGDRDTLIANAHDRIGVLKEEGFADANLYGEHLLGGLHHMSLLIDEPAVYGLPEAPQVATRNVMGSWLSGIITAAGVAVVPFWLLFRRKQELAAKEVSEGGE
jgi:formate dehydrogenase iron-sulfur subunit